MTWRDEAIEQVLDRYGNFGMEYEAIIVERTLDAAARTLRQHAPQRYGWAYDSAHPWQGELAPDPDGAWVRWDDFVALLGEREASEPRQAIADEQNAYIERQREREASEQSRDPATEPRPIRCHAREIGSPASCGWQNCDCRGLPPLHGGEREASDG